MALPSPASFARILASHISSIKDHLEGAVGSTAPWHFRQSTGNFQVTLPDAAGATQFRVNDSGGVDVFHIDSDGGVTVVGTLTFSGALVLPVSTTPAQTTDGSIVWDSDDDRLTIGDGSSRKTFYPSSETDTWITIEKAATETLQNNTLQNDDDFTFTAAANTDYLVQMVLRIASGTTPDWKFAWTLTGMTWDGAYFNNVNSTTVSYDQDTAATTSGTAKPVVTTGAATANVWLATFVIHAGSGGGTLNFQWAQNTTDASNTSLLKNSLMRYRSLGAT